MRVASTITKTRTRTLMAGFATAALVLAGCSSEEGSTDAEGNNSGDDASVVEIEDNEGTQTVPSPPSSVVALDNRTFETLDSWGVELSAAARSLMPDTISMADDESIPDVGNHREPNLETIVAAEPDLVISGQRFSQYDEQIAELVPDAAIVDLEPREGEDFDAELKRQTTALGEIFQKQDEAKQLVDDFDASIERVKEAYDPEISVMAVNASGGNINYLAPSVGRTLGPVFDIFDLTPALEVEGASEDHKGDDISVEAIADSNPDLMLVMDRDAAVGADEEGYTPAAGIISESAALQNVPAVQDDNILIMPEDTYTNEGIQTYTEFFNELADALEDGAGSSSEGSDSDASATDGADTEGSETSASATAEATTEENAN